MQDINHPDLFWPALDRLIAGAPSTSRVAHEVSRFLDREDAFKSLIEGSFRDEPDAAEWRKLCQKARAMARRKLAHPAPYAARLAFAQFFGLQPPAGLDHVQGLVPGDFACVASRRDWLDDASADGLVQELRRELTARGELPPQAGLIVGGVTHVDCGLPGASCAMVWGGCGRHLVRSHETPCPLTPTGSCALKTASPMRVIRERM